ncbi:MAG: molybdopterin-dependent oxidoreductase, partial [Nitrosomonas sp.]|nr:molybdopterin-dependent oxidoreductase [Nitrosomonas sp.]
PVSVLSTSELSGLNAAQMLGESADQAGDKCQAFILMNVEPEYDSYDSQQALKTIKSAEFVVSMSAYRGNAEDYSDVILPIAPFTETSGTYVSTEGRVQSFNGVVTPMGEARPAWKVIRVLANLLELENFDYETPEQVRTEIFPDGTDINNNLSNNLKSFDIQISENSAEGIQRIGEVPIYRADPIVRRAESLQMTQDATAPRAWMSVELLHRLEINAGDKITVKQGEGTTQLEAACDENLPANSVRIACAHPNTIALGAMFGEILVEKL